MFGPADFPRLERTLASPLGWLELGLALAAFAIGWLVDRHLLRRHRAKPPALRFAGSVSRMAMPLVALALLFVARVVWRRSQASLFLDLGIVLALALAGIRILVYTLRRLVPNVGWLKPWERSITFVVWAIAALYLAGVTPEILAELDAFELPIGKERVSLLTVLKGAAAVVITVAVTLWLSGLVEQRLMKTELDLSHRALASKVVRALLLVVGVLVALQAIGLDLTLLSVFGGALGVGIGLGLQKLASNYIAGFVILLDRSIRLGDLVTVADKQGTVTAVTSRYSVVRTSDGVEAIVPNETLITTTVLNHSYAPAAKAVRIATAVPVAYGTDLDRALAVLLDVARAHPRVEQAGGDHAPAAFVTRFGERGVDLELAVFVREPGDGEQALRGDLNLRIWKAFQAAGIALAMPAGDGRSANVPGPAPGA